MSKPPLLNVYGEVHDALNLNKKIVVEKFEIRYWYPLPMRHGMVNLVWNTRTLIKLLF
jgi:hypothetical protein